MQDVTSDDIATLRSRNISDDTILDKLSQFDTEHAGDFQTLKDRGVKPSEIIDKYVQFRKDNPSSPPQSTGIVGGAMNIADKAVKAFAHGTQEETSRLADSQRYVLGDAPDTLDKMTRGAKVLEGPNYDPASSHVGLSWDGIQYVPRAAVEALPQTAGYFGAGLAGGTLGPVGALAGMGLYGLARYWGHTAKERAANNGHPDQVSSSDVAGALPSSVGQALLDAAGSRFMLTNGILKPGLVTGAGKEALAQTASNFGKSAAVNALTSGASDLVGQAGATVGTDSGAHIDPSEALQAAKAGALVSSALKLPGTIKSGVMDIRQGNTDASVRGDLADLMASNRVTGDPSKGSQTDSVLANTKGIIGNDTKDAVAAVKAKIKANQTDNQPTDILEAALKTGEDALVNMKAGKLDATQADAIRSMTGGPEVQALKKQLLMRNELENITEKANKSRPDEGDSGPFHTGMSTRTALFHSGLSFLYGHPGLAALYAGPSLAAKGLKAIGSAALGSNNFVPEYVRRFGGQGQPIPQAVPQQVPPGAVQQGQATLPGAPANGMPAPNPVPQVGGPGPQLTLPNYSNVIHAGPPPRQTGEGLPYSILSLRAAAAGLNPNFSAPQAASTPEAPIAAARVLSKARQATQSLAEANQTPKAPQVAHGSPKASTVAPESSISIEPSVKIPNDYVELDLGEHGTRIKHQNSIRKGDNGAALAAGAVDSANTRKAITEAASGLKLSPEGMSKIGGVIKGLKASNEAHWNDNEGSAREQVAKAAEGLPEADRPKFKKHFETATHKGKSFYQSWKYRDKAGKIAGDKKKAAKAKERATKRQRAAQ